MASCRSAWFTTDLSSIKVDACNAAIAKIGQDVTIASLTEDSKASRVFNRVFDRVVDYVIADCKLPAFVRTVALAVLAEPVVGWGYRYAYPADCVDAIALHESSVVTPSGLWLDPAAWGNWLARYAYDFEVQDGTQDKSIVTSMEGAYLTYVSNAVALGRWGPLLIDALICRLAIEVAPVLASEIGIRLAPALEQKYLAARSKALVSALNESSDTFTPMTPSVAARQ